MAFVDLPVPAQPQQQWPGTDLGLASRVAHEYGDRLRFCQSEQCFYVYSGGKWEREKLKGSQRWITQTAMRHRVENPQLQTEVTTAGFIRRVAFHVEAFLAIDSADFDQVSGVLNFANGVLDLRSGDLLPHRSSLYLTQQIPYDYNPRAEYPAWKSHLDVMTKGNKEIQDMLQLLMGATLWGGPDRDQLFIHLRGKGRNGKGVFLRTLGKALGNYYLSAPINLFTMSETSHTAEYMSLKGTRMVACTEMGTNRLNMGPLKMMTGGDQITARAMRQDPVTFNNTWILWMATNYSLNTNGDSGDALWERYIGINLGEMIPEAERDNLIEEKLQREVISSGIIRWAVEGCLMWREMGSKVPIPDSVRKARSEERESSDIFGSYVEECLVITNQLRDKVTLQELAMSYETWRITNGEPLRMSSRQISADLRSRYGAIVKAGAGNRRTAYGVRLAHPQLGQI